MFMTGVIKMIDYKTKSKSYLLIVIDNQKREINRLRKNIDNLQHDNIRLSKQYKVLNFKYRALSNVFDFKIDDIEV